MTALAWCGSGIVLAIAITLMVRAIHAEAESRDEFTKALWAYVTPIPGAGVMGVAAWGISPPLLLTPAAVYMVILLVTRWRPLQMLGYFIDRVDRKVSDRYLGILFGLGVAAVFIGAFVKVAVFG